MWSRTYIVANTASRKKRIHSLLTPRAASGSARISSANASPWRNSSLHHFSNHRKIGWKRSSGCRSSLAVDRDVARVADLLGQVRRVEDELRAGSTCTSSRASGSPGRRRCRSPSAHWLMKPACRASSRAMKPNSSRMSGLVTRLLDLRVEHAAGELGGDRADQEVEELLVQRLPAAREIVGVEIRRALEVAAVGVARGTPPSARPTAARTGATSMRSIAAKSVV